MEWEEGAALARFPVPESDSPPAAAAAARSPANPSPSGAAAMAAVSSYESLVHAVAGAVSDLDELQRDYFPSADRRGSLNEWKEGDGMKSVFLFLQELLSPAGV